MLCILSKLLFWVSNRGKNWGEKVRDRVLFSPPWERLSLARHYGTCTLGAGRLLHVTTCNSLPAPQVHVPMRRALLSCSLSLTGCILIGCYLSHVRSHRLSLCTRTYHVTFHVIRCYDPGPPTDKLRVLRNYTSLNSGAYHPREWNHHSLTLDVS